MITKDIPHGILYIVSVTAKLDPRHIQCHMFSSQISTKMRCTVLEMTLIQYCKCRNFYLNILYLYFHAKHIVGDCVYWLAVTKTLSVDIMPLSKPRVKYSYLVIYVYIYSSSKLIDFSLSLFSR